MKKIVTYILMSVFLTACVNDIDELERAESQTIRMSAVIGNPIVATKTESVSEAVPWRGETPSESVPLEVKLLMSLESGLYSATPTSSNFLPCHTSITYTNSSPQDPENVTYQGISGKPKYPTTIDAEGNPSKVYCSGLFPKEGWNITESAGQSIANISIDGVQDVMYAPEIMGDYQQNLPSQIYGHLLSWIKVNVCCINQAATEVWGNVEKVWITSKQTLHINLATKEVSGGATDKDFLIHDSVIPLETIVSSVGSIFCVPATSYTLKIKVSNVNEPKEITIAPPGGATRFLPGKLYILEVYFNTTGTESICSLVSWDYQDEDLKLN